MCPASWSTSCQPAGLAHANVAQQAGTTVVTVSHPQPETFFQTDLLCESDVTTFNIWLAIHCHARSQLVRFQTMISSLAAILEQPQIAHRESNPHGVAWPSPAACHPASQRARQGPAPPPPQTTLPCKPGRNGWKPSWVQPGHNGQFNRQFNRQSNRQ